ncbi:MAG: GGDEF domain-containing protein, partial [Ruminococcus sp.]
PLVFTDIPIRIIGTMLFAIIVYLIVALPVMPDEFMAFNMYNIVSFSLVSMTLSSYLSRVKIERMLLMHRNKFLIECDQMTGLYNRASYDKDIQSVKPQEYFKLVSMDVNGLKRENDTYGHAAGDEMILSAAECLKKVIAPYGKCYRIGGDEFTAIIKKPTDQNFRKLLHDEAEKHICTTGTKLSISVGEADTRDSDSIRDIMNLADTRMYDEKKEYYRLSGDKR